MGVRVLRAARGVADFTARAGELAALRKIAAAGDQSGPVVLISGPPGTGKTTLAIRTAEVLGDAFRDGCFFVDLRGLSDQPVGPGDAASWLLRALGVAESRVPAGAADRAERLRGLLRQRQTLLILDNAASESQVRGLLPGRSPGLVVITSRRSLAGLENLAWAEAVCYRQYQQSIEHALAAHRIAAEAGDIRQQAWALAYAAYGYRELGDSGRCADLGRQSAALARQAGDQEAYSQALARLGDGLHGLGRRDEAMDVRLRLAALLTTPRNAIHPELAAVTLASVYVHLGAHCAAPGDRTRAPAYYEMTARLLRTRDVPSFESAVRMALGRVLAELGQRDEARTQFDAARSLFLDLNEDEGAAEAESARTALASS